MKQNTASIWTVLDGKKIVAERMGYVFPQEMACGDSHEFFVSKGIDGGWMVHEYSTGLYVHGGNATRSGMVKGLDRYIKEVRKLTRQELGNALHNHIIMNGECQI